MKAKQTEYKLEHLILLNLGGGIQFKPLRIKEAAIGALILLTQAFLRALKSPSFDELLFAVFYFAVRPLYKNYTLHAAILSIKTFLNFDDKYQRSNQFHLSYHQAFAQPCIREKYSSCDMFRVLILESLRTSNDSRYPYF